MDKFMINGERSRTILSIKARNILDSRGSWTVEVDLETSNGLFRDGAPSGASTGKHEAKTVTPETAVKNINSKVAQNLIGKDATDQEGIDKILKNLNVGANATTPVSMAICRAGAAAQHLPLYKYISEIGNWKLKIENWQMPRMAFNMINGGAHATNKLDFQEFMAVCDIKKASEIYQDLRKRLGRNVGDEGGFAPSFKKAAEALDLLSEYNVKIIIDVAARKKYNPDYYQKLIKKYPIIGLEDLFQEDDFQSWHDFKPKNVLLIGDDLLVTNPQRIKMAKEKDLCNAMILKVNQIGTISEALDAARLAKEYGWKIIVSHRSGETNDDFIADFAVGIGADYIKSGAPARGERVAKYNRLLRIKEELWQS